MPTGHMAMRNRSLELCGWQGPQGGLINRGWYHSLNHTFYSSSRKPWGGHKLGVWQEAQSRVARSLTRMLQRGCSSDLTRSGKEATAERPSKTWKEDGLKAESGWGRQICQGQGMKGGCGSGPNRGPRDRARERPAA